MKTVQQIRAQVNDLEQQLQNVKQEAHSERRTQKINFLVKHISILVSAANDIEALQTHVTQLQQTVDLKNWIAQSERKNHDLTKHQARRYAEQLRCNGLTPYSLL